MSVAIHVLDLKAARYKKTIERTARWLMKKTRTGNFYLEMYLVGDRHMKKNVLAFPAPKGFPRPDIKQAPLGDIYLNPSYIAREELEIGNWKLEIPASLAYMLIHGFLHLRGYDHMKKSDRIRMELKERKLLAECKTTLLVSTSGVVK